MSTGSLSDAEDFPEAEILGCSGSLKMDRCRSPSAPRQSPAEGSAGERGSPGKGRGAAAGKARKKTPGKKSPPGTAGQEGKQVQRNAANARERARMRVLSKAFSRLKTTLPWVPPDTKLSKLDTLRLASSYIAHLRQILASDKYENGYLHPVNLVSGAFGRRETRRRGGGAAERTRAPRRSHLAPRLPGARSSPSLPLPPPSPNPPARKAFVFSRVACRPSPGLTRKSVSEVVRGNCVSCGRRGRKVLARLARSALHRALRRLGVRFVPSGDEKAQGATGRIIKKNNAKTIITL